MSESNLHDSSFDDDPMERAPATFKMFKSLDSIYPALRESAVLELMNYEEINPDHYEEAELSMKKSSISVIGLDQTFPISIAGSNKLMVTSLYPPTVGRDDIRESAYSLYVELFNDGSPYIPDDMVPYMGAYPLLVVEVPLEGRPFLVSDQDIHGNPLRDEFGAGGTIRAYNNKLSLENRQPRYLTEDDASALISILPHLQVDPIANAEVNENVF